MVRFVACLYLLRSQVHKLFHINKLWFPQIINYINLWRSSFFLPFHFFSLALGNRFFFFSCHFVRPWSWCSSAQTCGYSVLVEAFLNAYKQSDYTYTAVCLPVCRMYGNVVLWKYFSLCDPHTSSHTISHWKCSFIFIQI